MIAINCTNCRHRLEMDDAFAGGVCRCQYCGTIQTVPARGGGKGRPTTPGSSSGAAKPLYKKGEGSTAGGISPASSSTRSGTTTTRTTRKSAKPGSGLDELAQIVASSGLSRGSLKKKPPTAPKDSGAAADDGAAEAGGGSRFPVVPVAIGGAVITVAAVAILIYFAMKPDAPTPAPTAGGAGGSPTAVTPGATPGESDPSAGAEQPAVPSVSGPAFADVPLPSGTVVYLVDRSQANEQVLDGVKRLVYKSAKSLGPSRTFQIIFWKRTDEGMTAYPDDKLALASPKEVDAAAKKFEDVVSYGVTELRPTLVKALKLNPQAIIIVSAKGFSLEERNAAIVKSLMKGKSGVRVHAFAVGEADSATLKQIAEQNGGEYRQIQPALLRDLAK
jgi:hypothetical protein